MSFLRWGAANPNPAGVKIVDLLQKCSRRSPRRRGRRLENNPEGMT